MPVIAWFRSAKEGPVTEIRPYDPSKERDDIIRLWREAGWFPRDDDQKVNDMADLAGAAQAWVADFNGAVEGLAVNTSGQVLYDRIDLPFVGIMTIAVGRPARKMGVAGKITTHAICEAARSGAAVVGLGCFEQGYYDRMGFGTGAYRTWVSFDPATLIARKKVRPPRRISSDEWVALHAARRRRFRQHGALNLDLPVTGRTGLGPVSHPVILGYDDGPNGEISHYLVMGNASNPDAGPYEVLYLCWQTPDQFDDLVAVLAAQGDQMRGMTVLEPPGVQWQDLLRAPLRDYMTTQGSRFQCGIHSMGDRQLRILDLEACIGAVHHAGEPLRFNLTLADPVAAFIAEGADWRGIGGEYTVTLGASSAVTRGHMESLPHLEAGVGAFSRMWFGVKPASGLALTDYVQGSPVLLEALDRALGRPTPHFDWFI